MCDLSSLLAGLGGRLGSGQQQSEVERSLKLSDKPRYSMSSTLIGQFGRRVHEHRQ